MIKARHFLLLLLISIVVYGCSGGDNSAADNPQIGTLSVDAYGPDYITIKLDDASAEASSVQAYIGLNGTIGANGTQVVNAVSGPEDLSSGKCVFSGLLPDKSYRVIVVAEGDTGSAVEYINAVRGTLSEITPADYPEMSDEEIGELKWALNVADDPLDDFSRIPSLNLLGVPYTGFLNLGFCSYRYSIAFYTYYLATIQYHKIPACQDIIKSRMDRLIQKMQQGDVWKYWYRTSTGYFTFPFGSLNPLKQILYDPERDPVRIKNIMYSGHLAQMLSLYEKLYGDMKYSEPESIVFRWSSSEAYYYDTNKLHKLLRDAFLDLPSHCIECEPNFCYAECQQHPILALMVYDQVHGTHYYDDIKEVHKDWYIKNNIIDYLSHDTSGFFLPLTGETVGPSEWDLGNVLSSISVPVTNYINFRLAFAAADGWTMGFMHAWQPEYIENHYVYNKQNRISSRTGKLKLDVIWSEILGIGMICDQLSVPLYAMLAGEVGDTGTRDKLLEQCGDLFDPEWNEDGSYCYPVGTVDTIINPTGYHFASSTTTPLAGIARSNPPDGLLKLHTAPFPGAAGPVVKEIDISRTNLRRAVYDSAKEVLVISTDKGTFAVSGEKEAFKIDHMDTARKWHLKIDGVEKSVHTGVSEINMEIPLDDPHDIILAAE